MHMRAVEHTINRGSCTHHAAWVNHTENRCKLAEFEPIKVSSPIDVLWFRISRSESDPKQALATRMGSGMFVVFIDRFDYWQVGCTIIKGGYKEVRASGLERLRRSLARVAPEWADRFDELEDWKQIQVLSVE